MSIRIETTIWIDKSPIEVFEFITEIANWPRYMPGMIDAQQVGDGEKGAGTRIDLSVSFLSSTMHITTEWTRWEPGVALGSANVDGSAMDTTMLTTLTEESGRTRLTRVDVLEPRSMLIHIAAPLIRRAVGRNAQLEFENIKEMLEAG
jgi:carbon monoxide dehydrogenase subunit G